jgi:hypothetical protein
MNELLRKIMTIAIEECQNKAPRWRMSQILVVA